MSFWPGLPSVIDAVIVVTLIEAALLIAFNRRTGRGVPPRDFVVNLASGLCLMLALRCAAAAASAVWVVLFVLLAGVLHGVDLWLRWRRQAGADISASSAL